MPKLCELLEQYTEARRGLLDYFKYTPQWRDFTILDQTDMFWCIYEDSIYIAKSVEDLPKTEADLFDDDFAGTYYQSSVVRQWPDQNHQYLLIQEDTHCDGNVYLSVYDYANMIELKEDTCGD